MHDSILVINAGSSSIKATFFSDNQANQETQFNGEEPKELVESLLKWISETTAGQHIAAIGHRIVHGGGVFFAPTAINKQVRSKLQSLTALDPEHLPTALHIIDLLEKQFPTTPQIACFDTEFFHTLPRTAQIIPIPRKYEAVGVRKYGFHGLSYRSVLSTLSKKFAVSIESSRIVCAHLGSGVSLAAIENGVPIDTTMSLTPTSGIPMSSRSGSLDPGIFNFLHEKEGLTIQELNTLTTKKSGLLGISETTPDMYTLLQQESTDIRSKEAIDVFCYEVKKSIGSLTAALGGVDILVFSGGMGENAPLIRQRICQGLEHIGIVLDSDHNQSNQGLISDSSSFAAVYVVHANEATVIAEQVKSFLDTQEH